MAGRSASSAIGEVNELRRRLKKIRELVEGHKPPNHTYTNSGVLREIAAIAAGERDEELFIEAQKRKEGN